MKKTPEKKSSKKVSEQIDDFVEKILEQNLEDVVGDRFGKYSKYIIQDRALPDIRDGLKPVQRRILYAMFKLGMTSDKPYKKSARIAGEVMGKYHPHGDSSIYEAMVRMSQNFKMRELLIDMHGNNGSIDGDPAAAMRYTEARLSPISDFLLQDLDKKTVDLVPNFDDEEIEPIVLPAKYPNLLVNGASGISAGYATEIPPHNLKEVIDACVYRLEHKNCSLDELMQHVKGPDFPTGGIIQGIEEIKKAYQTGRGKIIVRSKTHFEEIEKNQYRIVCDEIPYEVNKAEMVKKIDQLRIDKKFEDILEVRDESDREGLRVCIDLKKNSKHDLALSYLFKNTDMQISYNFNMVAICNRRPVLVGLEVMLDSYIEHQKEVITNRSNFELQKALKRVHILEGLIKMVSILTEVIETIRASKNKADSKQNLQDKFDFTELQAEAIVMLQLYKLSSTDVIELQKEFEELQKEIIHLNKVLSNENELLKVIKQELIFVSDKFQSNRRSEIEHEIEQIKINEEELIISEDVQIQITKDGYIKRASIKSYKASPSNGMKENDSILLLSEMNTKDTLLIFTNLGNYIYLPIYKIEEQKWKDMGTYIGNIVAIEQNEKIIDSFVIHDFNENKMVLLGTKFGYIKQVGLKDFMVTRYSKAIKAIKLNNNDLLVSADIIESPQEIIMATKNGYFLRYLAAEVTPLGTQALGIRGMKIDLNDVISDARYVRASDDLLILTSRGFVKRLKIDESNLKLMRRFRQGVRLLKENKSNPHFVVSLARMTNDQYREDVSANLLTETGNFMTSAFNFKYEKTDFGKEIAEEKMHKKSIKLLLNQASQVEKIMEIDSINFIPSIKSKEDKKDEEIFNIFDDIKMDLEETPKKDVKPATKPKKMSLFEDLF